MLDRLVLRGLVNLKFSPIKFIVGFYQFLTPSSFLNLKVWCFLDFFLRILFQDMWKNRYIKEIWPKIDQFCEAFSFS